MAEVDLKDDTIRRFIARHYHYDPARREWRHVVVAAFDNEPEFLACIERIRVEIGQRKELGERVDAREHATGVVYEPGYHRRAANGHLMRRATQHGVAGLRIDELELPYNMAVVRASRPRIGYSLLVLVLALLTLVAAQNAILRLITLQWLAAIPPTVVCIGLATLTRWAWRNAR